MSDHLAAMTDSELQAEVERCRRNVAEGDSRAITTLADALTERANRTGHRSPTWAERIGYPSDFDMRKLSLSRRDR